MMIGLIVTELWAKNENNMVSIQLAGHMWTGCSNCTTSLFSFCHNSINMYCMNSILHGIMLDIMPSHTLINIKLIQSY